MGYDELVKQRSRASAATVLTYFSYNISASVPAELTYQSCPRWDQKPNKPRFYNKDKLLISTWTDTAWQVWNHLEGLLIMPIQNILN